MNFGFEELSIVAPHEPVVMESRAAPGATVILRNAKVEAELLPAIADRTLVLGTSSLSRRKSTLPVYSLDQMEAILKDNRKKFRIALLFGSEKTGLRNADLSLCQGIVRIPTDARCPSMNLGQAVALCCYEMRRTMEHSSASAAVSQTAPPASVEEITRLADEIAKLSKINSTGRESARSIRLQQLLVTLPLSSQDVTLALGLIRDLAWKFREFQHTADECTKRSKTSK